MVGRVSLGSHRHIREQRHGSHRDGEAKHLILQFEVVSWSKPHHLSTFFCDFSLVKGPQIISMSNTKCGWFFFQLKKIWDVQVTKSEDHLYFFGKLSEQREKNKKKQNTSLKNPLNVQSIGGLHDPFVSLGIVIHPFRSLQRFVVNKRPESWRLVRP